MFFLSVGPVFAQVATASAMASPSATIAPVPIPRLRLPFDGIYARGLGFGESYTNQQIIDKLGDTAKQGHDGIDFELPEGTSVYPVDDGEVVIAGESDFGLTVKIDHAWGSSVYGHLKEAKVTVGQKVSVSNHDVIGLSGSTGIAEGPHLHFGIKPKQLNGEKDIFGFIDPAPYLSVILSKAKDLDSSVSASASARNDNLASPSATVTDVLGASVQATGSSVLLQADTIATDSAYLFNYKFNLSRGTTAHFYDKATKRPSFAIANENYDYKLRFFLENQESGITNQGESSSEPKVDGNTVEFPVVVKGIPMTLRYTIGENTVKEEFIIAEKPSQELLNALGGNLQIPFSVESVGLTQQYKNGEYIFTSTDGTVVWRILAPTVEDSANRKGTPEEVTFAIENQSAVLGVKAAFLKEASYPVIIDPTWTQTDWSGGEGTSTTNQYSAVSSVTTSVAGEATLTAASSWYNSSWKYRKKITLNNTDAVLGVTAETLTNFPVLVKLTSSNFDFTKAISTGQDIRFTDSDGTTALSYEIESWSNSSQVAYVWVKVPSIDTTGTDYIYAYYGNSGAENGQSAANVWDANYKGVWHLKETSGTLLADSKSINHMTKLSATEPAAYSSGQVNGAQDFDGNNDKAAIGDNGNQDGMATMTVSVWVNADVNPSSGQSFVPIGKDSSGESYRIILAGGSGHFVVKTANNGWYGAGTVASFSGAANGSWHQIVGVYDGSTVKAYVDGVLKGTGGAISGVIFDSASDLTLGFKSSINIDYYNGKLDEARLSATNRSAAWIAAEYKSGIDSFNTFASEEPQVATSGTLTSAIFDTQRGDYGTLSYTATTPSNTSVSVKARSSNSSTMSGATDFSSCTAITSGAALSTGGCVTNSDRYIQYQITLTNSDAVSTPTFQDVSLTYTKTVSTAPSGLSGVAAGTTSITWSWTDNSSDEDGFYVQDTSGNTVCTISSANTTTCTETGLTPNTTYTRNVVAFNSGGNSSASSNASATTRIVPAPTLESPADSSYTNNNRPSFRFRTPTDNTSSKQYTDISSYKLTINNTDSTYITVSGIPASRTTDYSTDTYTATYEGFSDADITNNYITIYTKSSSSWNSTSNDGKLKEGKNTWYVASVDATGNISSASRVLYADYSSPAINNLSSSDRLGEKDGYLILTEVLPTITATITDNLALNKVTLNFIKENYFLGVITSTEPVLSQTYTLTSSDNATNYSLIQKAAQSLGFGSFQVDLATYDKAGNTSKSTLKFKIMTAKQAQELLVGKITQDDTNKTTISLADLEKKVLLRREIEAQKLSIFLTTIKNGVFAFAQEIGINVSLGQKIIADAFSTFQQQTIIFKNYLAKSYDHTHFAVQDALSQAGLVVSDRGKIIAKDIEIIFNNTDRKLVESQNHVEQVVQEKVANTRHGINQNSIALLAQGDGMIRESLRLWSVVEDDVQSSLATSTRTIEAQLTDGFALIGNTMQKSINLTRNTVRDQAAKTQLQTASVVEDTLQHITKTASMLQQDMSNSFRNASNSIVTAQHNTQSQIAKVNSNTSKKLQEARNGIELAIRSVIKPAVDAKNTADRVGKAFVIAVDTFQAYVFDESPTRISEVALLDKGKDYVVISWKTNHYTRSNKVNYGENLSYGKEAWGKDGEKEHLVKITGLKPDTKYFFEVMGQNKNYVYDAFYSFDTEK